MSDSDDRTGQPPGEEGASVGTTTTEAPAPAANPPLAYRLTSGYLDTINGEQVGYRYVYPLDHYSGTSDRLLPVRAQLSHQRIPELDTITEMFDPSSSGDVTPVLRRLSEHLIAVLEMHEETAEEREMWLRRRQERRDRENAEYARRQREKAERQQAATEKARELLISFLTPRQRREYAKDGTFRVKGTAGNWYRIQNHRDANVQYLARYNGKAISTLCVGPTYSARLPVPDVALAQLFALTTNEFDMVKIANLYYGSEWPPVPGLREYMVQVRGRWGGDIRIHGEKR